MALNVINVDWTPIYDLGKQIVEMYKQELTNQKVNASGSLSASIDFDLDFNADEVSLYFIANSYYWYIEKGRQKTRGGGESWPWKIAVEDIAQWMRNKISRGNFIPRNNHTIPRTDKEIKSVSYCIVRKIHQYGFYDYNQSGLHILQNVLEILEMRGEIEKAVNKVFEQYDKEINITLSDL